MKKKLLALLLILSCLCLSGCQLMDNFEAAMTDNVLSIVADKAEESGADVLARQFIDGLMSNDPDTCLAAMVPGITMESLLQVFPQMRAMLPQSDAYTLTPTHWNTNISQGVTQTTLQFLLTVSEETFVVQTVQISTIEGLYNIHIAPTSEQTEETHPLQKQPIWLSILFTLLSLGLLGLIVFALVDCCRHKFHRRWLWILLILFANVLLILTLSGTRFNFNFRIGLYLTASTLTISNNGFAMQLMLPIGSVIYLLRRKKLHQSTVQAFTEAFKADSEEAPVAPMDTSDENPDVSAE